jgi:hypothetical protein
MALVPTFPGDVSDDGKLELPKTTRRDLARYVKTLKGKHVTVVVTEHKATRSQKQSRYWWAVAVPLCADHCGYTPSQMHYALLGEWGGYVDGPGGKPIPVKPSSSELTVEEFGQLITWILDWAPSELGVFVPEPDWNWRAKQDEAD